MKLFQEYLNSLNGFKDDCGNLIDQFKNSDKNDYATFVLLWRSHKFYVIYEKYRHSCFDNNEFKKDSLQIAKEIMLTEHFVGGLFLLFGLYYIQEDPKSYIRIELHELEKIMNNIHEERRSVLETFQPALMFVKLMKNNAFSYVRFSREYDKEGQIKARLRGNGQSIMISERIQPTYWIKRKTEEMDIFKNLKKVNHEYSQLKVQLKKEEPKLNLALNMLPADIIGGLQNAVAPNDMMKSNQRSEIGDRRRRLKNRKLVVKQRYSKPEPESDEEYVDQPSTSSSKSSNKGSGVKRITYIKRMVNESDSEVILSSDDEENDSDDDFKLELPDI